jgi:4-hydroxy-tetrahydrodipicolinate synthase
VRWQGIFPAVTTKFTEDLALDHAAMERHFAWQVACGVDGLIVAGSLGEGSTLNHDERLEIAATARRAAAGVPVVLTIAESATHRAVELARRAEASGVVDGLMVLPPLLYHASAEEVVAWYRAVADGSGLPVMAYNNPVSYKVDVTPEVLEALADHPRIVA